jgi:translation initiation factor eIF-2B subunit alpha/methylthioribose-1-phosphate isomerase
MIINGNEYQSVWMEDNTVRMINQNKLPFDFEIVTCNTSAEVAEHIQRMTVRGAPAIGAAGAYGMALAAQLAAPENFRNQLRKDRDMLLASRPTAIDLNNGVRYVYEHALKWIPDLDHARTVAFQSAHDFALKSSEDCRLLGEVGQTLIEDGMRILTHCNAGALATVDWGTALSVIRMAHRSGKKIFVYVDETRPKLQGSRLTAFELKEEGVPHAIIVDSAAGFYMEKSDIDLVITGADRVCLNGDIANKIGTYSLAVLAKEHMIPFYVAAPQTTFDLTCMNRRDIPIEERSALEITQINGNQIANPGSHAFNPAFDVTPARLITAFITSKGIFKPKEAAQKIHL